MVMIVSFGFSMNSAILRYGLDIYDGGGASQVFAFSGAVSIVIWAMCVRAKINVKRHSI